MKYVFPLFICALFASCFNEGDCLVTATNKVRIQFKKKKNPTEDTLVLFSYYSIQYMKQDTVKVSEILLPLNVSQALSLDTIVFNRLNADSTFYDTDTLKVSFDKQTKVISKDCGAYTFYQNLKVKEDTLHNGLVVVKTISTSLLKNPTGSSTDPKSYALIFQILY